jgi:hypothetical protein
LEAVSNQTIPFANIVHIDGISPEYAAHNLGVMNLQSEWAYNVNGDTILLPNAVELALERLEKDKDEPWADRVYTYNFGLYDAFERRVIAGCAFFRASFSKSVPYSNKLTNDRLTRPRMEKKGYIAKHFEYGSERIVVGTHIEGYDDFQIFRRFFALANKNGWEKTEIKLQGLCNARGGSRFRYAWEAFQFGRKMNNYRSSHNINFDREMFELFNREREKGGL